VPFLDTVVAEYRGERHSLALLVVLAFKALIGRRRLQGIAARV
jgi:hypothetical protein